MIDVGEDLRPHPFGLVDVAVAVVIHAVADLGFGYAPQPPVDRRGVEDRRQPDVEERITGVVASDREQRADQEYAAHRPPGLRERPSSGPPWSRSTRALTGAGPIR